MAQEFGPRNPNPSSSRQRLMAPSENRKVIQNPISRQAVRGRGAKQECLGVLGGRFGPNEGKDIICRASLNLLLWEAEC